MSYKQPLNTAQIEIEIKKSRFIGFAKKVTHREDAIAFVNEQKAAYPDARHVCWGYVIGDPKNSTNSGCHDDGEPSGTAGKPILAQINYSHIGNVVVAIVRYFGGIRLGAGGLVRAYRQAAQAALMALETEEYVSFEDLTLALPFNEETLIRQLIASFNGQLVSADYGTEVTFKLQLPQAQIEAFTESIGNFSAYLLTPDPKP